jgi:glycosyltransferase involved in cell wall biosynthesis
LQVGDEVKAMGMAPAVSIIIPTFNREKFVFAAIRSVLDQSFSDFEVLVIDDGSTDRTADIVRSFNSDKVRYVYQANHGRSNARNHALRLARGHYIAFLDSDDLYMPGKLGLQVEYLDAHPDVGMVYTSALCIDDSGSPISYSYDAKVSGWIYEDIAFFRPVTITLPTVMARREVFDKVGGFDEKMERFEDTDMWRRIAKCFVIGAIPTPTCLLRTHEGNALEGQNPKKIEAAVSYYIDKVFAEDTSISRSFLYKRAADLCFFYAKALLTMPTAAVTGRKLLVKSISYTPSTIYRLAFLGYYFLFRQLKRMA